MKPFPWLKLAMLTLCLMALFLGSEATPRVGQAATPPPPADFGAAGLLTALPSRAPASITKDKEGYTIWTYDYSADYDEGGGRCVMYSRIRWPFDLGGQDPSELSNTSLILTWAETPYSFADGQPTYKSAAWNVGLNAHNAGWAANTGFTGEWNLIGAVATAPTWPELIPSQEVVEFDNTRLIDGENNLWFQQQDFCGCAGLPDCACTCYRMTQLQLRALVALGITEVSPAPDTRNVWPDQRSASEIRVKFTTLVSNTTVNEETFQVYYYDQDVNKVYVEGDVRPVSPTEFVFTPRQALRDGIRYVAQVWGENDALSAGHDAWVQDRSGGPLEDGQLWFFWTLPQLQVRVLPIQVLEGQPLIVNKATVLRAFIRWDRKEDVFWRDQAPTVTLDDLAVAWASNGGADAGAQYWSAGGANWLPDFDPQSVERKREYREFTTREESYTNRERYAGVDSVNFFGFTPAETGGYHFTARALVKDSQGRPHAFIGSAALDSVAAPPFQLRFKALAVGADFGKTGVVDLSTAVRESLRGFKALFPVASVQTYPAAASAIPYYNPTTPLWLYSWATQPAGTYPKKYLLQELNRLCLREKNCRAMIGFAPPAWPAADGLTWPEIAPRSAFVKNNVAQGTQYIMAHELGHLASFEHLETPAAEGYNVQKREVMCYSIDHDVFDFMTEDPVEAVSKYLWITENHYTTLGSWTGAWSAQALTAVSADPLLLVAGVITPTTDATALLPWYQLEAGAWTAPVPGPYRLVFLNASGQEIVGYTRAFTVEAALQPAGNGALALAGEPAPFAFAVPYPTAAAKVQLRRAADNAVLAEVVPAASAPTLAITPPPAVWQGAQLVAWQSNAPYFAVDVSTDGGATWQALAIDLTAPAFTVQTTALADTAQAYLRVAATDGLRTTTAAAGPFTINNPPLVSYVEPSAGATGVSVNAVIRAGFRDAMAPATLNAATFTLTGPGGSVPGVIIYDPAAREATFTPKAPLAYAATYTARVTTGVTDAAGEALPAAKTWTFTTVADTAPPAPLAFAPADGALRVPRRATLAVVFDRALNAATVNASTFQLATAQGAPVSGAVSYDAASRVARFTPAAPLAPDTLYVATLKAGLQSAGGVAAQGDFNWAFTTGVADVPVFALTGGYADAGRDANGDGLYEALVIRVGVQVTATSVYALRGALVDVDGGEIAGAVITRTLSAGAHFLELSFDGAAIGGHGVDGPYTLTDLTLSRGDTATAVWDAYRTFAYPAARFPAPLRLSGLPDVVILPENTFLNAFNVWEYAQHISRPSSALSYTVRFNSQPQVAVALQATGDVWLTLEPYWRGQAQVTLRATDGVYAAQDTFTVLAGWPQALYLPLVLREHRDGATAATRSAWVTLLSDGFEGETIGWRRYGWTYKEGDPPPGGFGQFQWGLTKCRAYAGQQSVWAYGGGDDGERLPCGATYPAAYSMGTDLFPAMPVNLKYTARGEFSAKVWTNLAPDDELCLKVAVLQAGDTCETGQTSGYYGVCRTGQSNGWADLSLNLANVPTLGNLLGQEKVCARISFIADIGDSRPEGAYVDDVTLRVCPAGLEAYCGASAAATTPALVAGGIGGYPESISGMVMAVEANGRIHAVWVGKLNPNFNDFLFYSTSTDGVNWTPYQILDYWDAGNPQLAVDNVHGRTHLTYSNLYDGIFHRVILNGVPGPATLVVPRHEYYQPGLSLPAGGQIDPRLAVNAQTGIAHLVWQEGYYKQTNPYTYSFRRRAWYAYWQNGVWSAPQQKINDIDTADVSIAAAPAGQTMMAWFQQWEQSSGGGVGPGAPLVARTAYGEMLSRFPLRQATHALYPEPQRDESIVLSYAPGADAFVLASSHFMWSGHSRTYRYIWKDGVWSDYVSVAGNTSGWSSPYYIGAAANSALIRYVYSDNWTLKTRTETGGVLSAPQAITDYLSERGYTGSPLAYFTDASGGLHLIVQGQKAGVEGVYYVRP